MLSFKKLITFSLWLVLSWPLVATKTFIFNDFNKSSVLLIKDALIQSEQALTLTNHSQRLIGRALYPTPIRVKNNNASKTVFSFSTSFVFSIATPPPGPGGHGLAFIMTPSKSLNGAIESQYLGLFNTTTDGLESNHLFAVEFDTNFNVEFGDIDDNHVGVDLNSLRSIDLQPAGYWKEGNTQKLDLKSGENIQAWIDYDNLQDQLNVTVASAGMEKPTKPLVSVKNFNLSGVLREEMYVGFSAATGFDSVGEHYILRWSFSMDGKAPLLDLSGLPSFVRKKPTTQSRKFKAGITVASILAFMVPVFFAFLWLRKRRNRESVEAWELEYWPHRISYNEIVAATQGFRDGQILGFGGFGRVYKGILPRNGLEVAVKCITKDSTAGMKEFIAEISSVGRLQHRNLVQLRGWCRKNNQLFIVYDFMPNGSLEKKIFGNPKEVLPWPQRYSILKDIATGLLYLHEQWDRKVVHRDVKSSNVLLDSDLNAKLGDFGLARLYDHTQNPQTTRVVGTVGYIAPEVTSTGKVSPSSDVFSFGIVVLEVACGRRPIDQSKDVDQIVMLDWVRFLHGRGKLLDAVDPNLNGDYDAEEVERVVKVGLYCSHPEAEARLSIRTALQILEGEAPLPGDEIPSPSPSEMNSKQYSYIFHGNDEAESSSLPFGPKFGDCETSSATRGCMEDSDYQVGR